MKGKEEQKPTMELKLYALEQSFIAQIAQEFIRSKSMSEEFLEYFLEQKKLRDEVLIRQELLMYDKEPKLADLKSEKLKVLSDLQHRILKQHVHGKIKSVEGMIRCVNDQVFIMQQEISHQL